MSTPLLYEKVTLNIKKPLLAVIFFIVGFLAFSISIVLLYRYGIIVPKKESVVAVSSFVILFVIYGFLTYDSHTGFKFPYFMQKYLIDPKLRLDLEFNQPTHISHAHILDIQPSSKSTYALLLQSKDLTEPEWFQVNLNLMFPKLYFFHFIQLEQSCIGQNINIEYLPQSKVILKMTADKIEDDFSSLDCPPFLCVISKSLKKIPSQFLLSFNHIQQIHVERESSNTLAYNLICITPEETYTIASSTTGFRQLELALSSKINWTKYKTFMSQVDRIKSDISK